MRKQREKKQTEPTLWLCPYRHFFGRDTDKSTDCDDCDLWDFCTDSKEGVFETINTLIQSSPKEAEIGRTLLISNKGVHFVPWTYDGKWWHGIVLPTSGRYLCKIEQRMGNNALWRIGGTEYEVPAENEEISAFLQEYPTPSATPCKTPPKPETKPANDKYHTLLKHPKWQRRRLEVFNRDTFTCQACQDTETMLHCHHIKYTYGAPPWESPIDDLVTLCENCHATIENLKKSGIKFDLFPITISYYSEISTIITDTSPKIILYHKETEIAFTLTGEKKIREVLDLFNKSLSHD